MVYMVNDYFYNLAMRASIISGIPAEWIYCQWRHESDDFSSDLAIEAKNLGGLTQDTYTEFKQPDGENWYMVFPSYERYAEYYGRYLKLYEGDGIFGAQTIEEFAQALKNGGYYGDTVENYTAALLRKYEDSFGGQ